MQVRFPAIIGKLPGGVLGCAIFALTVSVITIVAVWLLNGHRHIGAEGQVLVDTISKIQLEIFVVLACLVVIGGMLWFHRREIRRRDKVEKSMALATDRAEDTAESKALFLANMSHELRSPLNAIIGFSELIKGEIFGETRAEYKEYAENIHESGTHLLELINDILDMSKLEAGKAPLDARVTDIASLVEACQRLVGIRAETKGLAMVVKVDKSLPPLFADERKIRQILINLLTNAIKFTPTGGRITTSARLDVNGDFLLEVKDTGIGIAPENLEKVLEPFGQVASELGRKQQGTGLGLPLTNAFVKLHGGTLTVESAIGEGTTVTARFPASQVIALEQKVLSFAR
ncbi:MAG: hypothetical protein COA65_01890 [Rhodospirillaceae bacterium]|nr:MAG: hypothetical protein COA65_01890 [Rhodospirillaceae bacterium]